MQNGKGNQTRCETTVREATRYVRREEEKQTYLCDFNQQSNSGVRCVGDTNACRKGRSFGIEVEQCKRQPTRASNVKKEEAGE